jgi:hypothetical protein
MWHFDLCFNNTIDRCHLRLDPIVYVAAMANRVAKVELIIVCSGKVQFIKACL